MGVIKYKGRTPIPEVGFQRSVDISIADFDGSDTAGNMSSAYKMELPHGTVNPWGDGFLVQAPSTDGVVQALTWSDYINNGKVVDDTKKQPITLTAGFYSNVRVVKIYSAGNTSDTTLNIGV